ncbi:hypothetical protein L598_001900000430 [Mesorhizobium sp. J18]|uniref:hypothetical protein n=1 Tax=Mesorhizobium sp. J18 TaxID=935263 RepID=UPI00119B07DF|nr:hypothetical protein [Mesorhizobium sp. J18]TWG98293.1 hypothetical protein L598_001900000430 [Mesorhizobium sp. J18]
MRFCYFAFFEAPHDPSLRISEDDLERTRETLGSLPGMSKAHIYQPAEASDLYTDDGTGPVFGFQLYFDRIEDLETSVGSRGVLKGLADSLPSLGQTLASQQAMLNRQFPVPEEKPFPPEACSYLVHYPGPAQDLSEWLAYYLEHHPAIMARFPGIREIEILSRIDWIDSMPWRRVHSMQRNRVMFDSDEALTAALHSPVRHEMRADFAQFPAFEGGNFHHPMLTERVLPRQ